MSATVANNKLGVSILVAALVGIGFGSLGYVRHKDGMERKKEFEVLFAKVNETLPQGFEQKHVVNSGLFSTEGKYTLSYKNKKDGKYDSAYVTDYKVSHGLGYYFTGSMKIEATSKLEGFIASKVKSSGPFMTTTGEINGDGDSQFLSKGNQITVGDNSNPLVIKPFNIVQSYNAKSGDMKNTFNFPTVEFKAMNKPVTISGITMKRDGNKANMEIGLFSLNVASIVADKMKSDGFEISSHVTLDKDTYNDKGGMHIRKIVADNKQVFSKLDLDYTIKGIDAKAADYFISLYKSAGDKEEMNEQDMKVAKENMARLLQKGLAFNLDKLNVEASFGTLDVNAKLALKPVNSPAEVSIKDQLNFNLTAKAQGEVVPMVKARYAGQMENMPIPVDTSTDPKKWDLTVVYENNQIKVNGEALPEEATAAINQMSENFNAVIK